MRCRLLALALVAVAARSAAAQQRCKSLGPCNQADSVQVLIPPDGDPILVTNFGIVVANQFICEEAFGGRVTPRMAFHSGSIYIPTVTGLVIGNGDGCAWRKVGGVLDERVIMDVAFGPPYSPGDPARVLALVASPRGLYLSTDRGNNFSLLAALPTAVAYNRIGVAPSDPQTIYLAGFKPGVPLVLAVSRDGGKTFRVDEEVSSALGPRVLTVDFLGVAPDDPQTVYLALVRGDTDELWRATDQGQVPVKILGLSPGSQLTGFAFGEAATTLYAASRDLLDSPDRTTARLTTSKDAGKTWTERPSAADGPRYRCLHARAGKLYACGAGESGYDRFLLGVSSDEGRTWQPVTRLGDIQGPRACAVAACGATRDWLCLSHGICGDVPERPLVEPRDGGAVAPKKSGGCSFGGGEPSAAVAFLIAALLLRRRS